MRYGKTRNEGVPFRGRRVALDNLEEEGEGEAALANAVAGHTSGRLTTMTHSVVRRSGPKNESAQSVIEDVALTVT